MRRSPFYAYPNSYHQDFYPPSPRYAASSARGGAYHPRRHSSQPASASEPAPFSVVTIPVQDSSSPRPQQQQTKPADAPPAPTLDSASAATRIQSCFRGFAVRCHKPLLHLRSVAAVRRQLEELQSELENPGFPSRVRANNKERLRVTESVMAILLRLDAVEGAIPEVRSQRKEATRKAIQLQDAIDAMTLREEEKPSHNHTEGPASSDDVAKALNIQVSDTCVNAGPQSERGKSSHYCPEAMMNDICTPDIDDDAFAKDFAMAASPEEGAAEECAILFSNAEDAGRDSVSALEGGENNSNDSDCAMAADAEIQYELASINLAEGNGVNDLEEGSHAHMSEHLLICLDRSTDKENGDEGNVVETLVRPAASAEATMEHLPNVPSAGTMRASESFCHRSSPSKVQQQGLLTSECSVLEGITDKPLSPREVATPMECRRRRESEESSQISYVSAQPEVASDHEMGMGMAVAKEEQEALLCSSDRVLLQQLSHDCKQLKSLLGKLLVQSRAQSKVISALGDRLESLEQQQQQQQQQCQKTKCKKKGSSKKERLYHSKARTFKWHDAE